MDRVASAANPEFSVTLDMIQAGVERYLAFDSKREVPETLVAEILLTARDMWQDGSKNVP